jgi:large-conductance mechanosensitive channel
MVKWIVLGVVLLALVILAASVFAVLDRLNGLERAARRLQRRQTEAMKLQQDAVVLEETVVGLQRRAETMQGQLAVIKAGHGSPDGKHSLQKA